MIWRWLRWFVVGLAGLYTLSYGVWRILLLTPWYDRFWQLPLSEVFGSWFYLPLPPLIPLAILTRSRRTALILLLPLCFFTVEYGRQFLPNWQPVAANAARVRLLTWNTHSAADGRGEFQALIHQLQPDYVAIQEVNLRLVRLFKETLNAAYPYQVYNATSSDGGLALFSRFPLQQVATPVRLLGCQCMTVESELAGRPVTFIVAHIWRPDLGYTSYRGLASFNGFNTRYQTVVFDQLVERIATVDGPLVVLGDLNTSERQPNYHRLRAYLEDAYAAAGWGMGYTFPANSHLHGWSIPPLVRIDHILINRAWQARTAWSSQLPTSDHGYVVADLVLRP
jgi:endonuclease/exonuclease/phosphatase (EEP) superfamily protein YafD